MTSNSSGGGGDGSEKAGGLSAQARAILAQRLRTGRGEQVDEKVPRIARGGAQLPASFAQERFWFLEQLDPGKPGYHLGLHLQLFGSLDLPALRRAITALSARHEGLRTSFRMADGALEQVIDERTLDTEVIEAEDEATAHERAVEIWRRPFDLTRGPLGRAAIIRISDDEHVFVFVAHHIICDGWTLGSALGADLAALYDAFRDDGPSPLPELAVQYADFAAWERARLSSGLAEKQLAYWVEQLAGAPAALELPGDRPRPAIKGSRGSSVRFALSREATANISAFARAESSTRFNVLLAAFNVLLARLSGQHDIVIGTAVANRGRKELEPIFGCFNNTVAMRTKLHGAPSFREVLQRTQKTALDALERQELPFERVVEALRPVRDASRTPVYQVMYAYHDRTKPFSLSGVNAVPPSGGRETSLVDLWLVMAMEEEGLAGALQYDADVFDHATVERFVEQFELLLASAIAEPQRPFDSLPMMSADEHDRLVSEWEALPPRSKTESSLGELFEEQARKTPGAVAIASEDERLTYQEVSASSRRIASHIRAAGVGPGSLVSVLVERSPARLVAMLGVLEAGCVCVGIEPDLPPADVARIVEAMSPSLVLTRRSDRRRVPPGRMILELEACARGDGAPSTGSRRPHGPAEAACVAYRPRVGGTVRGLAVEHRAIATAAACVARTLALGSQDVVLDSSDASESNALATPFAAWMAGASVLVLAPDAHRDAPWMLKASNMGRATVLTTTPRMLRRVAEDPSLGGARTLRAVCTYGDTIAPDVAARFLDAHPARLIALHGSADAFAVTIREHTKADDAASGRGRLGHGIDGPHVRLLDEHLEPTAVNVPGIIFVEAPHDARGYVVDPTLTAARFVDDPKGRRLFATGMRARRLADGSLEPVGVDSELELGGYLVDVAEAEALLRRDERVSDAAILVRESTSGDPRLVVYVVCATAGGKLERLLQDILPDLPSELVTVDAIPKTTDGRVDREALEALAKKASSVEYVPPANAFEESIAQIWQDVLRLERVGRNDDFFALGGHSLLGMRVVARLSDSFGIEIPLRTLFDAQTLSALGTRVLELVVQGVPEDVLTEALGNAESG